MEEFVAILFIGLFICFAGWSIFSERDTKHKCKEQGMVLVSYDHNYYCANIGDLK